MTFFEKNLINLAVSKTKQTIGNHEFDNGVENLAQFINAIESPMVLANVDFSEEPKLQGKFLNSTVIVRNGRKIGIIGVIAKDTDVRASKCFFSLV